MHLHHVKNKIGVIPKFPSPTNQPFCIGIIFPEEVMYCTFFQAPVIYWLFIHDAVYGFSFKFLPSDALYNLIPETET